jgi:hypothetical protein
MADDYARVLNIVGLLATLAGVLILFRWGMPFRVASGGHGVITDETADPAAIELDRIYTICGWIGLGLLLLGTVLQVIAQLLPPTALPNPPNPNP